MIIDDDIRPAVLGTPGSLPNFHDQCHRAVVRHGLDDRIIDPLCFCRASQDAPGETAAEFAGQALDPSGGIFAIRGWFAGEVL